MSKNNIKLLTSEELEAFVKKYKFEVEGLFIWVEVVNFNRPTVHPKNESFSINCNNRKLTISPEAIELWEEHFKDKNLIEVQQAVNKLILMYQKPDAKDVAKILNEEI